MRKRESAHDRAHLRLIARNPRPRAQPGGAAQRGSGRCRRLRPQLESSSWLSRDWRFSGKRHLGNAKQVIGEAPRRGEKSEPGEQSAAGKEREVFQKAKLDRSFVLHENRGKASFAIKAGEQRGIEEADMNFRSAITKMNTL